MATVFSTATLSLNVDTQQFNKQLGESEKLTVRALRDMQQQATAFETQWADLTHGIKDTKRIVSGILISQGFYALMNGISGATAAALQFSSSMEQASVSLEYFVDAAVGTKEAANSVKAYLREVNEFAARTPFNTDNVLALSKYLASVGVELSQTQSVLTVLTDAAAATGASSANLERVAYALGQILTKGRLANEEIRQLANANIPIYEILKEELGLTGEQISKIGKSWYDADKAVVAILRGLEKRYQGAADRIADTFMGMTDTILDNAKIIANEAFGGLYDRLVGTTGTLRDTLDHWREIINEKGLPGLFNDVVLEIDPSGRLGNDILTVIGNLKNLKEEVIELYHAAQPLLNVLGRSIYVSANVAVIGLTSICDVAEDLLNALQELGISTSDLAKAIASLYIAYQASKVLGFMGQALSAAALSAYNAAAGVAALLPASMAANTGVVTLTASVATLIAYLALSYGLFTKLSSAFSGLSSTNGMNGLSESWNNAYNNYEEQMKAANEAIEAARAQFREDYTAIADDLNGQFKLDVDDPNKNKKKNSSDGSSTTKEWVAAFDEIYDVPDAVSADDTRSFYDDVLQDLGNILQALGDIDWPTIPVPDIAEPKLGEIFGDDVFNEQSMDWLKSLIPLAILSLAGKLGSMFADARKAIDNAGEQAAKAADAAADKVVKAISDADAWRAAYDDFVDVARDIEKVLSEIDVEGAATVRRATLEERLKQLNNTGEKLYKKVHDIETRLGKSGAEATQRGILDRGQREELREAVEANTRRLMMLEHTLANAPDIDPMRRTGMLEQRNALRQAIAEGYADYTKRYGTDTTLEAFIKQIHPAAIATDVQKMHQVMDDLLAMSADNYSNLTRARDLLAQGRKTLANIERNIEAIDVSAEDVAAIRKQFNLLSTAVAFSTRAANKGVDVAAISELRRLHEALVEQGIIASHDVAQMDKLIEYFKKAAGDQTEMGSLLSKLLPNMTETQRAQLRAIQDQIDRNRNFLSRLGELRVDLSNVDKSLKTMSKYGSRMVANLGDTNIMLNAFDKNLTTALEHFGAYPQMQKVLEQLKVDVHAAMLHGGDIAAVELQFMNKFAELPAILADYYKPTAEVLKQGGDSLASYMADISVNTAKLDERVARYLKGSVNRAQVPDINDAVRREIAGLADLPTSGYRDVNAYFNMLQDKIDDIAARWAKETGKNIETFFTTYAKSIDSILDTAAEYYNEVSGTKIPRDSSLVNKELYAAFEQSVGKPLGTIAIQTADNTRKVTQAVDKIGQAVIYSQEAEDATRNIFRGLHKQVAKISAQLEAQGKTLFDVSKFYLNGGTAQTVIEGISAYGDTLADVFVGKLATNSAFAKLFVQAPASGASRIAMNAGSAAEPLILQNLNQIIANQGAGQQLLKTGFSYLDPAGLMKIQLDAALADSTGNVVATVDAKVLKGTIYDALTEMAQQFGKLDATTGVYIMEGVKAFEAFLKEDANVAWQAAVQQATTGLAPQFAITNKDVLQEVLSNVEFADLDLSSIKGTRELERRVRTTIYNAFTDAGSTVKDDFLGTTFRFEVRVPQKYISIVEKAARDFQRAGTEISKAVLASSDIADAQWLLANHLNNGAATPSMGAERFTTGTLQWQNSPIAEVNRLINTRITGLMRSASNELVAKGQAYTQLIIDSLNSNFAALTKQGIKMDTDVVIQLPNLAGGTFTNIKTTGEEILKTIQQLSAYQQHMLSYSSAAVKQLNDLIRQVNEAAIQGKTLEDIVYTGGKGDVTLRDLVERVRNTIKPVEALYGVSADTSSLRKQVSNILSSGVRTIDNPFAYAGIESYLADIKNYVVGSKVNELPGIISKAYAEIAGKQVTEEQIRLAAAAAMRDAYISLRTEGRTTSVSPTVAAEIITGTREDINVALVQSQAILEKARQRFDSALTDYNNVLGTGGVIEKRAEQAYKQALKTFDDARATNKAILQAIENGSVTTPQNLIPSLSTVDVVYEGGAYRAVDMAAVARDSYIAASQVYRDTAQAAADALAAQKDFLAQAKQNLSGVWDNLNEASQSWLDTWGSFDGFTASDEYQEINKLLSEASAAVDEAVKAVDVSTNALDTTLTGARQQLDAAFDNYVKAAGSASDALDDITRAFGSVDSTTLQDMFPDLAAAAKAESDAAQAAAEAAQAAEDAARAAEEAARAAADAASNTDAATAYMRLTAYANYQNALLNGAEPGSLDELLKTTSFIDDMEYVLAGANGTQTVTGEQLNKIIANPNAADDISYDVLKRSTVFDAAGNIAYRPISDTQLSDRAIELLNLLQGRGATVGAGTITDTLESILNVGKQTVVLNDIGRVVQSTGMLEQLAQAGLNAEQANSWLAELVNQMYRVTPDEFLGPFAALATGADITTLNIADTVLGGLLNKAGVDITTEAGKRIAGEFAVGIANVYKSDVAGTALSMSKVTEQLMDNMFNTVNVVPENLAKVLVDNVDDSLKSTARFVAEQVAGDAASYMNAPGMSTDFSAFRTAMMSNEDAVVGYLRAAGLDDFIREGETGYETLARLFGSSSADDFLAKLFEQSLDAGNLTTQAFRDMSKVVTNIPEQFLTQLLEGTEGGLKLTTRQTERFVNVFADSLDEAADGTKIFTGSIDDVQRLIAQAVDTLPGSVRKQFGEAIAKTTESVFADTSEQFVKITEHAFEGSFDDAIRQVLKAENFTEAQVEAATEFFRRAANAGTERVAENTARNALNAGKGVSLSSLILGGELGFGLLDAAMLTWSGVRTGKNVAATSEYLNQQVAVGTEGTELSDVLAKLLEKGISASDLTGAFEGAGWQSFYDELWGNLAGLGGAALVAMMSGPGALVYGGASIASSIAAAQETYAQRYTDAWVKMVGDDSVFKNALTAGLTESEARDVADLIYKTTATNIFDSLNDKYVKNAANQFLYGTYGENASSYMLGTGTTGMFGSGYEAASDAEAAANRFVNILQAMGDIPVFEGQGNIGSSALTDYVRNSPEMQAMRDYYDTLTAWQWSSTEREAPWWDNDAQRIKALSDYRAKGSRFNEAVDQSRLTQTGNTEGMRQLLDYIFKGGGFWTAVGEQFKTAYMAGDKNFDIRSYLATSEEYGKYLEALNAMPSIIDYLNEINGTNLELNQVMQSPALLASLEEWGVDLRDYVNARETAFYDAFTNASTGGGTVASQSQGFFLGDLNLNQIPAKLQKQLEELGLSLEQSTYKFTSELSGAVEQAYATLTTDPEALLENLRGATYDYSSVGKGAKTAAGIEASAIAEALSNATLNLTAQQVDILAQAGIRINADGSVTGMYRGEDGKTGSVRNTSLAERELSAEAIQGLAKYKTTIDFELGQIDFGDFEVYKKELTGAIFDLSSELASGYSLETQNLLDQIGTLSTDGYLQIESDQILKGNKTFKTVLDGLDWSGVNSEIKDRLYGIAELVESDTTVQQGFVDWADGIVVPSPIPVETLNAAIIKDFQDIGISFTYGGKVLDDATGELVKIDDKTETILKNLGVTITSGTEGLQMVISNAGDKLSKGQSLLDIDDWREMLGIGASGDIDKAFAEAKEAAQKGIDGLLADGQVNIGALLAALGVTWETKGGQVLVDITGMMEQGADEIVAAFVERPELWDQLPETVKEALGEALTETGDGLLQIVNATDNGMLQLGNTMFIAWNKLDTDTQAQLEAMYSALDAGVRQDYEKLGLTSAEGINGLKGYIKGGKLPDTVREEMLIPFEKLPPAIQKELQAADANATQKLYQLTGTVSGRMKDVQSALDGVSTNGLQSQMGTAADAIAGFADSIAKSVSDAMTAVQNLQRVQKSAGSSGGLFGTGLFGSQNNVTYKGSKNGFDYYGEYKTDGTLVRYIRVSKDTGQQEAVSSLPKFASGGIIGDEAAILAGELGKEMAILPNGRTALLDAGLYRLPAGTNILNAEDTKAVQKYAGSKPTLKAFAAGTQNLSVNTASFMPATASQLSAAVGIMEDVGVRRYSSSSSTNMAAMVDTIAKGVLERVLPQVISVSSSTSETTPINVGMLIADDAGLRMLERKLYTIRQAEAMRRGN